MCAKQANASDALAKTNDKAFQLSFAMSRFQDSDFVSNTHLITSDEINMSLAQYNVWLRRFFVCVTDEINPMVAQVFFYPHSDRVQNVVCRTPMHTRQNFLDMDIITEPRSCFKKEAKTVPLLIWYLQKNPDRRCAEHVEMWTSPEDVANHPNDLNIFGGLEFDEKFNVD